MASRRAPLEVAQTHEKKGEWAKAASAYLEHVEAKADDARAWLRLAEIRERLGEGALAAKAFRALAQLQINQGFNSRAVSVLRRSLQHAPEDTSTAVALAEILGAEGKLRDALGVLSSSAEAAKGKGDTAGRFKLLEMAASLDPSAVHRLAWVDALVEVGHEEEALAALRRFANDDRPGREADRLRVIERLAQLSPGDASVAASASRIALFLQDPRRALLLVRTALDSHPEDPELFSLAAQALSALGEKPRAALVHKEAARRFAASGLEDDAREEWRRLLRLEPKDAEGLAAVQPALAHGTSAELFEVPEEEDSTAWLDVSVEDLDAEGARLSEAMAAPPESGIDLEPLSDVDFELVSDDSEKSSGSADSNADSGSNPARGFDLSEEALTLAMTGNAAHAQEEAEPQPVGNQAMVVGEGPEGGWASRALSAAGLDVKVVSSRDSAAAAARFLEERPGWIFSPSEYAEAWTHAGVVQWIGATVVPRFEARARVKATGLATVESLPVREPRDLATAAEALGTTLQLVGPTGPALTVADSDVPALWLALARQRFGQAVEIQVQAAMEELVYVAVAGNGRAAIALGEWCESKRLDVGLAYRAPRDSHESERIKLAEAIAAALGLRGIAVLILGRVGDSWRMESLQTRWDAGALTAEARSGQSLLALAVGLARGEPLPATPTLNGAAISAETLVPPTLPTAAAIDAPVRWEVGLDSSRAYLCVHAPDLPQALDQFARAIRR